jgi:hypothetical protein
MFAKTFVSCDRCLDNLLGGYAAFPEFLSDFDEGAGNQVGHCDLPLFSSSSEARPISPDTEPVPAAAKRP